MEIISLGTTTEYNKNDLHLKAVTFHYLKYSE